MRSIESKLTKAATHLRAGNLAKTEAILKSILRTSPRNVDALNLLGMNALTREDYADAIRWL